jgi:hypothetical protein
LGGIHFPHKTAAKIGKSWFIQNNRFIYLCLPKTGTAVGS